MTASPASSGRTFIGTFALVFLSIGGLFAIDTFLAKTERTEDHIEGVRLFDKGQQLMQQGRNAEAIDPLKGAVAIERTNRDYRLALAQAQLAAGETADAETTLNEILQKDSTDGPANLAMARVQAKEGKADDAISYYHRAIYGHWSGPAETSRLQVRFELIDVLAKRGAREELLAELLPVQEEAPDDVATRLRLGQLYLTAGSPVRASPIFRDILRKDPQNGDAYAGLGEAEFDGKNYRTAREDFEAALRLKPDDQNASRGRDLCNQILMLDPTQRGLSVAERYRRSLKLVQLSLDEVASCAQDQGLLDQARKVLKQPVSVARLADASEDNLNLAEQLWDVHKRDCKSTPDRALALVIAKIAQ
jgi:Tfp pilus assembly protein PilF